MSLLECDSFSLSFTHLFCRVWQKKKKVGIFFGSKSFCMRSIKFLSSLPMKTITAQVWSQGEAIKRMALKEASV